MLKNEFNVNFENYPNDLLFKIYKDGYFFEIFNSSRKEPYDGFSLTGLYGIRKVILKYLFFNFLTFFKDF